MNTSTRGIWCIADTAGTEVKDWQGGPQGGALVQQVGSDLVSGCRGRADSGTVRRGLEEEVPGKAGAAVSEVPEKRKEAAGGRLLGTYILKLEDVFVRSGITKYHSLGDYKR